MVLSLTYKHLNTDPVTAADHLRRLCTVGVRYGSRDHCLEIHLTPGANPVEPKKLTARFLVPQSEKFGCFSSISKNFESVAIQLSL